MNPALLGYMPADISAHGGEIDRLMWVLHIFMALLFVGWGIFFAYCLIRFRAKSGHAACYELIKAKPSKAVEAGVVVVEAVLLIGFSMPVWAKVKNERPAASDNPLEVRVVAQQFAWNIHYPGPDGQFGRTDIHLIDETTNPLGLDRNDPVAKDDVATINTFYMPTGRTVLVRLTSKDVIHSFWIPQLRVKQDVIPGMEIPIWFEALKTTHDARKELARMVDIPASGQSIDRLVRDTKSYQAMEEYAKEGSVALRKGALIDADAIKALQQAGITQISIAPSEPVQMQCAQLCGLGHYRMKGVAEIMTPEEFQTWYDSANEEEVFEE